MKEKCSMLLFKQPAMEKNAVPNMHFCLTYLPQTNNHLIKL